MKQLYEVRTRRYISYYVLANGYDEAKKKVQDVILEKDEKSILTQDGSLRRGFDIDEVFEIRCLTENFIL